MLAPAASTVDSTSERYFSFVTVWVPPGILSPEFFANWRVK
jgi:hypothetical protein